MGEAGLGTPLRRIPWRAILGRVRAAPRAGACRTARCSTCGHSAARRLQSFLSSRVWRKFLGVCAVAWCCAFRCCTAKIIINKIIQLKIIMQSTATRMFGTLLAVAIRKAADPAWDAPPSLHWADHTASWSGHCLQKGDGHPSHVLGGPELTPPGPPRPIRACQ